MEYRRVEMIVDEDKVQKLLLDSLRLIPYESNFFHCIREKFTTAKFGRLSFGFQGFFQFSWTAAFNLMLMLSMLHSVEVANVIYERD